MKAKAVAPGKLLLTGAYAVLEGAPAVVLAVDRCAIADCSRPNDAPSAEVRAAFGDEPAPYVDTRALHDSSGRKLGLGSSAAGVVAALAARSMARGQDPRTPLVRAQIFRTARLAHALVQDGGSGVDVAASVHGGLLRYRIGAGGLESSVSPLDLAPGLVWMAYDSGASARTSDMRGRVAAFRAKNGSSIYFGPVLELAWAACAALEAGEARAFVRTARAFGDALAALGRAADVPVVLPSFAELALAAEHEDAAFLPSGAGGGDVGVWLSTASPSAAFVERAKALSMRPLVLSMDATGVRPQPG
ncbi:MAG: hypothetical protein M3O50_10390 [Myxococcota bacterium]|nr:hypothetical protein [Myxococcota bacterium]